MFFNQINLLNGKNGECAQIKKIRKIKNKKNGECTQINLLNGKNDSNQLKSNVQMYKCTNVLKSIYSMVKMTVRGTMVCFGVL